MTGAALLRDWTANLLSAPVTGLVTNTTYWLAVLVRDGAGNTALYTPQAVTTLGGLAPGQAVNIEIDVLARYLQRMEHYRGR